MEDTSKQEILKAIGLLSEQVGVVGSDVSVLKTDVSGLKTDVSDLKTDVSVLKTEKNEILEAVSTLAETVQDLSDRMDTRMDRMQSDITSIKATMVTKPYLDDKLSDLRSDMVGYLKKSDHKTNVLVEELVQVASLPKASAKRVLAADPFARRR